MCSLWAEDVNDLSTRRQKQILAAFGFNASNPPPDDIASLANDLARREMADDEFEVVLQFLCSLYAWADMASPADIIRFMGETIH